MLEDVVFGEVEGAVHILGWGGFFGGLESGGWEGLEFASFQCSVFREECFGGRLGGLGLFGLAGLDGFNQALEHFGNFSGFGDHF